MTTIEARAIENARKELNRAKNELKVHRLSETRYRGIPTVSDTVDLSEVHGVFVYRGVPYIRCLTTK